MRSPITRPDQQSARPAELSSPHTDPGKVAQLGVGSRARGSRGRLCRLHRRAGVTPKAKIRLCAPKILYSKHCSAGNRPIRWLPARGPGQSRRATLLSLPLFIWDGKPLPPGAASVHGTLAQGSPGTDAGAVGHPLSWSSCSRPCS